MNTKNLIARFLILFFLGLGVYFNCFSNKFLLDDYAFLADPTTNNSKHLLEQFSPYQTGQTSDPAGAVLVSYRPLNRIVSPICYSLFGDHFWKYHLLNLFLFVLAAFLIYICVLRISKNDPLAFLTAAFYLIHPINGIMVNYITANVFALQVILIASSILCVWEAVERNCDRILYYASLLLMTLSLFCHETSIMAPFYIASVLIIGRRLDLKKLIACLIPYFIILFVYLVFRTYFVSLNETVLQKIKIYQMNFFEYTASLFVIFKWYITRLFYPEGIVMVWATPVIRKGVLLANLGLISLIGLCIYAGFVFRRNAIALLALAWFVIGFVPMVAAPFNRPSDGIDIEPHWFAFSVIGFFILAAHSLLSLYQKMGKQKGWIIGVMIFLLGMSWATISRTYNRLWSDEKTYAIYWLKQSPQLKAVYCSLAHGYELEGNLQEARKYYLKALSGEFNDMLVYNNLGFIEKKLGHFKESDYYFHESLKLNPSFFANYANLGNLYLKYGKLAEAKKYYITAVNLNPYDSHLIEPLISISFRMRDVNSMGKYIYLYIQRENDPGALIRFGDAMVKNRFLELALRCYHKASDNNPSYPQIKILLIKENQVLQILHSNHP